MPVKDEDDAIPAQGSMSKTFEARLTRAGLLGLRGILENARVHSCNCLSALSDADICFLRRRVRAAGFGIGHARSFDIMCREAKEESLLAHKFSDVAQPQCKRLRVTSPDSEVVATATEHVLTSAVGSPPDEPASEASRSPPDGSVTDPIRSPPDEPIAEPSGSAADGPIKNVEDILCPKADDAYKKVKKDYTQIKAENDDTHMKVTKRKWELCSSKPRASREAIIEHILNLRKMEAEVVSWFDRKTGKMCEARVPEIILALLRLHASCSGKEVTEQRIARLALDLMEEQGYDPVRAVSSLSPASLLLPDTAVRVIGSGFVGIVFLEETSGHVVKVMLDENGKAEYDLFCEFAKASLAPTPISCVGPRVVPGGQLYSIRMEAIPNTLQGVLSEKAPRGARRGYSPPSEELARKLGHKVELALRMLFDAGLVHADLHMGNVGVKDLETSPAISLIDFGSSSSFAGRADLLEVLTAGHEFDVFRLIGDMCDSFEAEQEEFDRTRKECERELRELKKEQQLGTESDVHVARQVVALQAYLVEETLEQVELMYNIVLKVVAQYAIAKFKWTFEGAACVGNRRMRSSAMKRQNSSQGKYFNHFFGGGGAGA